MEIAGATAMWTRPDTGDSPVSYPSPTLSAVKGIFESILWGPSVQIIPTKAEICSPLVYHAYQTNYGGPLRKPSIIKTGGGFQLLATVLIDVCYRIYANVEISNRRDDLPDSAAKWSSKTTSPGHAHQAIFNRRLKRGQCFATPCLGWKEFVPSYFGPLRSSTQVQTSLNTVIPSMLQEVFPNGYKSEVAATYRQNVEIVNGVLIY